MKKFILGTGVLFLLTIGASASAQDMEADLAEVARLSAKWEKEAGSRIAESPKQTLAGELNVADADQAADLTAVKVEAAAVSTTQAEAAKTETAKAESAKSEAEIPVLNNVKKTAAAKEGSMNRLLISFGIVIVVAAGLMLFARQWAKRKSGLKQHHQIKVLTQYPMGPKRSLAIIRVAGETILIGLTDHNISMIKSLSIIDEEMPAEYPESFSNELMGTLQTGADEADAFELGPIRDRVTKSYQARSN